MANAEKDLKVLGKLNRESSKLKAQTIVLELFVSGITPKSIRAIEVLKDICETYFANRYELKVVDIYREPQMAKQNEVFAVPTLIRRQPGPRKILIGDMTDTAPVFKALGIKREVFK
ncbi:MAG: hypothetical protein H7061_00585 [Bdellovibrionaceae bacterium]|nr:hypothetical protein [Bdellovibrio sp.]